MEMDVLFFPSFDECPSLQQPPQLRGLSYISNGEVEFDNAFFYDHQTSALHNTFPMADASPSSAKVEQAKAHSCTSCTASMTSNPAQGVRTPRPCALQLPTIGYNIAYGQPSITPPDESTIVSSEKLDHLDDAARQSVDPPDAPPIQASYVVLTGRPGRPRIEIEPSILAPAIELHGPTHLAAVFQVSARTVRRRALEYGLVEPGAPVYVNYEAEDGTVTRFYTSSTAPTNS
ncbi:hypothetical protein F4604DRAFT_1976750 [Suillus subluteus]|nr:hypothetical protein F4604DRAFT_1976750 [Suillus subluteus]